MKKRFYLLVVIPACLLFVSGCNSVNTEREYYCGIDKLIRPSITHFQFTRDSVTGKCYVNELCAIDSAGESREFDPEDEGYARKLFTYWRPPYQLLHGVKRISLLAKEKGSKKARNLSQDVIISCSDFRSFFRSGDQKNTGCTEKSLNKLTREDLEWMPTTFSLRNVPDINENEEYVLQFLLSDSTQIIAVGKSPKKAEPQKMDEVATPTEIGQNPTSQKVDSVQAPGSSPAQVNR